MSTFEEVRIPVPWGHIAGKAWNDPSGLPVFLAHGLADNAASFDNLIALLPKSHYYVAVDWPGHGNSSTLFPDLILKFTDFIAAVNRVADHFKWAKFTYIGHSAGGYIGHYYTALFPDRVSKLIILDEPLLLLNPEAAYANLSAAISVMKEAQKLKESRNTPAFAHRVGIQRIFALHPDGLTVGSAHALAERMMERHSDGFRFRLDHRALQPTISQMSLEQTAYLLGRIKCPVLQIAAADSVHKGLLGHPKGNYKDSEPIREMFRENLKDAYRFEMVEGKHNVHTDYPERLSDLISDFLANA